mgnify:CR=1 FL=1
MEFGCHLPVYGPAATRDVLLGFARRMEALGLSPLGFVANDYALSVWGLRPIEDPAAPGSFITLQELRRRPGYEAYARYRRSSPSSFSTVTQAPK